VVLCNEMNIERDCVDGIPRGREVTSPSCAVEWKDYVRMHYRIACIRIFCRLSIITCVILLADLFSVRGIKF
jgi:hypothetical protein